MHAQKVVNVSHNDTHLNVAVSYHRCWTIQCSGKFIVFVILSETFRYNNNNINDDSKTTTPQSPATTASLKKHLHFPYTSCTCFGSFWLQSSLSAPPLHSTPFHRNCLLLPYHFLLHIHSSPEKPAKLVHAVLASTKPSKQYSRWC